MNEQELSNEKEQGLSVESLLEKYGAPDGTFEVKLPGGEGLVFRRIETYGEIKQFMRDTAEFLKVAEKSPHPAWKEALPVDQDSRIAAYTLHRLCVGPIQFDLPSAFRLMRAGWLVDLLMAQLDANRMRFQVEQAEQERVEQEKKDS
jgi:hypothetical protein